MVGAGARAGAAARRASVQVGRKQLRKNELWVTRLDEALVVRNRLRLEGLEVGARPRPATHAAIGELLGRLHWPVVEPEIVRWRVGANHVEPLDLG